MDNFGDNTIIGNAGVENEVDTVIDLAVRNTDTDAAEPVCVHASYFTRFIEKPITESFNCSYINVQRIYMRAHVCDIVDTK